MAAQHIYGLLRALSLDRNSVSQIPDTGWATAEIVEFIEVFF